MCCLFYIVVKMEVGCTSPLQRNREFSGSYLHLCLLLLFLYPNARAVICCKNIN